MGGDCGGEGGGDGVAVVFGEVWRGGAEQEGLGVEFSQFLAAARGRFAAWLRFAAGLRFAGRGRFAAGEEEGAVVGEEGLLEEVGAVGDGEEGFAEEDFDLLDGVEAGQGLAGGGAVGEGAEDAFEDDAVPYEGVAEEEVAVTAAEFGFDGVEEGVFADGRVALGVGAEGAHALVGDQAGVGQAAGEAADEAEMGKQGEGVAWGKCIEARDDGIGPRAGEGGDADVARALAAGGWVGAGGQELGVASEVIDAGKVDAAEVKEGMNMSRSWRAQQFARCAL